MRSTRAPHRTLAGQGARTTHRARCIMRKRLSIVLLVLPALLLGGCALEPSYRYDANAGGGYYVGQSSYGNADTVVVGAPSGMWDPWGAPYAGWYGFGPWIGFGGFN